MTRPTETCGPPDAAALAQQLYHQVWNGHRYELAETLYASAYTSPSAPGLRGGAAKAAIIRAYHQAFPDLTLTVEDLIATNDRVAARLLLVGTDTGGFRGCPPTGRTVRSWAAEFLRSDHGRIVEDWVGADWLGILEQLGRLDSPWNPT